MRHTYYLDRLQPEIEATVTPGLSLTTLSKTHLIDLSELMIAAYQGTIDYDDETVEDARAELNGFLEGKYGDVLYDCSWVCFDGEQLISTCLVTLHQDSPLISYVMTHTAYKNRGLGYQLLKQSLASLAHNGFSHVLAVITENNTPSEVIFQKAGFVRKENPTS